MSVRNLQLLLYDTYFVSGVIHTFKVLSLPFSKPVCVENVIKFFAYSDSNRTR